jgi:hypothetical protein
MLRRETGNTKIAENVFNLSKDVMKEYFLEVSKCPERDEKPQICKGGVVLSMDKMKALLSALD